jgi:hypothetical protein
MLTRPLPPRRFHGNPLEGTSFSHPEGSEEFSGFFAARKMSTYLCTRLRSRGFKESADIQRGEVFWMSVRSPVALRPAGGGGTAKATLNSPRKYSRGYPDGGSQLSALTRCRLRRHPDVHRIGSMENAHVDFLRTAAATCCGYKCLADACTCAASGRICRI